MKTLKFILPLLLVLLTVNCTKDEPLTTNPNTETTDVRGEWRVSTVFTVTKDNNTDTVVQENSSSSVLSSFVHKLDNNKYFQTPVGITSYSEVGTYTTDSLFYGSTSYQMILTNESKLILQRLLTTNSSTYQTEKLTLNRQ